MKISQRVVRETQGSFFIERQKGKDGLGAIAGISIHWWCNPERTCLP